jgi:alpha-D-xyloside xylohydrolase
MKFNDGYWRLREGVRVLHPAVAYDVEGGDSDLTVIAPTKPMENRGSTIGVPALTLRARALRPDVIAVSLTHHAGGRDRGPRFDLAAEPVPGAAVRIGEEAAVLTAGALSVRVEAGDRWDVQFLAEGKVLTSSGAKCMGSVDAPDGRHYMLERLALGVGETVYGLGERFTPLVKNGQAVDVWNDDGGTSSELAYKNVPFYLTNRGYGVFVNSPGRVSFEVGSEVVSRVQFSVPGQTLEYVVVYGPTPKEILAKYTALTGRPALPPAWSFGLWLSSSFVPDWDEATLLGFADEMARREIPLSVLHFDCFWMREFHLVDFEWNRRVLPDPAATLAALKSRGIRSSVWINPYIGQQSALFQEGKEHGYLLCRPDGDVWQTDTWQAGMAVVDFTNPQARQWYADKLTALLDTGVDCFKTDFGERIPTDVVFHDGSDPELMHNYYSYLYNQTVFDVLLAHRGPGEAVVFARSATAGSQQFPVHWGGDPEPTYVSMAESLRGGLSLGLSGFGFWSHDIGGFEGTPTRELFKRWVPFGLLSSHSRLHGSISYRVPWLFGEEAVDVLRRFTRLKMRLMPYLFGAATQAHTEGTPLMRAMVLEFPDDPACWYLERQYMLGPDLLVAPVFTDDGAVTYYVPAGDWTSYLTGEVITGPRWATEQHGFDSIPLLVRPGAVLPTGRHDDRPDYDYRDGVTLEVFTPQQGTCTVVVPSPTGDPAATFTVTRRGDELRATAEGTANWRLLLVGVTEANHTGRGTLITPDDPADELVVMLTP